MAGDISFFKKLFKWQLILSGLVCLLGLASVGYGLYQLTHFTQQTCLLEESESVASNSAVLSRSSGFIYVDIAGAVKEPGIYQLPLNNRLSAAIEKAGGLTKAADLEYLAKNVNLAQRLADEDKIYIFSQVEQEYQQTADEFCQAFNNSLTSSNNQTTGLISINQASASQLETLEGIGEKRAEEIINNRPYSSLDELVSKEVLTQTVLDKVVDKLSL